jgi:predicted small lipoprotein YifL
MKKLFGLFLILLLCLLLSVAGCGSAKTPDAPAEDPPVADVPEDTRTPVVGAITIEDGRKVDGVAFGGIGDDLTNVFFSFCIDKAELKDEFEGEKAERGFIYLYADVTVKNAFDGPIPMWAADFIAQWGEGDNDYCYPLAKVASYQMDDEFTLAEGRTVSKSLVYEVPLPENKNEYKISYLEYFEDGVEGNLFLISFELSAQAD